MDIVAIFTLIGTVCVLIINIVAYFQRNKQIDIQKKIHKHHKENGT